MILQDPSVKDKNPKRGKSWLQGYKGETPLHLAAKDGHLEICQLLIIFTVDKSPKMTNGTTPG